MKNHCEVFHSPGGLERLYRKTLEEQKERNRSLEAEIKELRGRLSQVELDSASPVIAKQVVSGGTVTNNILTQNLTVNVFGHEEVGHIGRERVREILDGILEEVKDPSQAALAALLRTAIMIYSDPTRPENLTCYLPNKKNNEVMVHGDDGWEIRPCQLVLSPMTVKTCNVLFVNQPFENAEKYTDLMVALRGNEEAFQAGKTMRPVLVRNRELLEKALGHLPQAEAVPPPFLRGPAKGDLNTLDVNHPE